MSNASQDITLSPTQSVERANKRLKTQHSVDDAEYSSALALFSLASGKAAPNSISMQQTGLEGPAPVSPESRLPESSKRVTFDPQTKDVERTQARRFSIPPRIARGSRLPNGFARAPSSPPTGPAHRAHMMGHWFNPHNRMLSAQRFMPPPIAMHRQGQSNQWICDYCNIASFPTYEDACLHEQACRLQCGSLFPHEQGFWGRQMHFTMQQNARVAYSHQPMQMTPLPSAEKGEWCEGAIALAVPHSDADWLSELNCFIRSGCVEAFTESEEGAKGGRASHLQVGIRCKFCKHKPDNEKEIAAVSFPASLDGIYESVKRWQRVHLQACNDIPCEVKNKVMQLDSAGIWIPNSRQYWIDSARMLGMVDTDAGVRFGANPERALGQAEEQATKSKRCTTEGESKGEALVTAADINMIPPYVYFLMRQVETCMFTEADRFIARSKGQLGFAGFQCRHCNGHAGLGKYFPLSAKSLATNSTSQNVHAHLLKCRKCPQHVKDQLVLLKEEKNKSPRLEPGWRKIFFDKIWVRLHGKSPDVQSSSVDVPSDSSIISA